jgi:hypothetical protein
MSSARTNRAPTTLIRRRPSRSWRNSTSPLAALEAAEVHLLVAELNLAGLDLSDLSCGQEHPAAADACLEARDRRIAAVGEPHDQIINTADLFASPIKQRTVQERRQIQERDLHSHQRLGPWAALLQCAPYPSITRSTLMRTGARYARTKRGQGGPCSTGYSRDS